MFYPWIAPRVQSKFQVKEGIGVDRSRRASQSAVS